MTKQQVFLYAVQTAILANSINITSRTAEKPGFVDEYRHVISPTGVIGMMHDIAWASERIPDDMTAVEAANEFCGFMLANLRDEEEKATRKRMTVPYWFARS